MERAKKEYDIDDYSVSQTSLEQVFINFARAQHSEREVDLTLGDRCARYCRQCLGRSGRNRCLCCVRAETDWNSAACVLSVVSKNRANCLVYSYIWCKIQSRLRWFKVIISVAEQLGLGATSFWQYRPMLHFMRNKKWANEWISLDGPGNLGLMNQNGAVMLICTCQIIRTLEHVAPEF